MSMLPADAPRRTPAPRKLTLQEMRDWDSANSPDRRTPVSATTSEKVLAPELEVSAYQHSLTTSDSPVLPPNERGADAGTLWTFSAKATRARTAAWSKRKVLRFPPLRRMYAKTRHDAEGNITRKGTSYKGDIWTYLAKWGFRTLNDLDGAGYAPPSHSDLADLFEGRMRERATTYDTYYSNRGHGISYADIEMMADAAATAVLRDWSPDWIREQRARARRGGQISKRAPKWDDADLDALAALKGMTVAQQAVHLGVSPSTVDRMRRALRARQI